MGKVNFPLVNIRKTTINKWKMHHYTGTSAEKLTIPYDTDADGYHSITLIEVPDSGSISGVTSPPKIEGLTEYRGIPVDEITNRVNFQENYFWVNYQTGAILFHPTNAGEVRYIDYWGRGSLLEAEDINDLDDRIRKIEILDNVPFFRIFTISNQPQDLEFGQFFPVNKNSNDEYIARFHWEIEYPENIIDGTINILDVTNNIKIGQNLSNSGVFNFVYSTVFKYDEQQDVTYRIQATMRNKVFFEKEYTISWKYKIFYGSSPKNILNIEEVKELNSKLSNDPKDDYEFPPGYFILGVPQDISNIERAVDQNYSLPIVFGKKQELIIPNENNIAIPYDILISENRINSTVIAEIK